MCECVTLRLLPTRSSLLYAHGRRAIAALPSRSLCRPFSLGLPRTSPPRPRLVRNPSPNPNHPLSVTGVGQQQRLQWTSPAMCTSDRFQGAAASRVLSEAIPGPTRGLGALQACRAAGLMA